MFNQINRLLKLNRINARIIWGEAEGSPCFEEFNGACAHNLAGKVGDCAAAIIVPIGSRPFAIRHSRLYGKSLICTDVVRRWGDGWRALDHRTGRSDAA